jgi:AcrR family transcriptional regulator
MYPSAAPRRLTRAEKQEATRQRLLDAAAGVFIRRGLQAASIEEIAAEAGFTRGAFYSNFESKEELFVELLQQRVYERYREIVTSTPPDLPPAESLRWVAEKLTEIYRRDASSWLFALWLECLAHAARHPEFRSLAATFWSGTRALGTGQIAAAFEQRGVKPPIEPKHLATATIALDIGLAVQNLVDPDDVPLEIYPPLYELLFARLLEPGAAGPSAKASRGGGSSRASRGGGRPSPR